MHAIHLGIDFAFLLVGVAFLLVIMADTVAHERARKRDRILGRQRVTRRR